MPQNHANINNVLVQILTNRSEEDKKRIDSAEIDEKVSVGSEIKTQIIEEMKNTLEKLRKKKQITEEQFEHTLTALNFYKDNIQVLSFNPNPHAILAELTAIDYSQEISVSTIKSGRLLTQMQSPFLEGQQRVGNFYAEGIIPADFDRRADITGIGVLSVESDATVSKKSVYMCKVDKICTALVSTAAPATDTWSVPKTRITRWRSAV